MAPLKVYDVKEMRDERMPRALCTLLGARPRGQSPYWVAAHSKDEALTRLREVGSDHRAHHLRVVPIDNDRRHSLFKLLTTPGDVIGYVRTAEHDPIGLIPAGETDARIVARWERDPDGDTTGLIPVLTTPENETAVARQSLADERASLDAQLNRWRADNAVLRERHARLRERDDDLISRWVAAITDDEILGDEDVRRELCRRAEYHTAAHNRLHPLCANEHVMVSGCDGREEVEGNHFLPSTTIMLEGDSDVAVVATAIDDWFKVWALGRTSLVIHVMESTLSANGSYGIEYTPGQDATLRCIRHSRRLEITAGPLVEVLRYVARNHPYYGNSRAEREEWDDED